MKEEEYIMQVNNGMMNHLTGEIINKLIDGDITGAIESTQARIFSKDIDKVTERLKGSIDTAETMKREGRRMPERIFPQERHDED